MRGIANPIVSASKRSILGEYGRKVDYCLMRNRRLVLAPTSGDPLIRRCEQKSYGRVITPQAMRGGALAETSVATA